MNLLLVAEESAGVQLLRALAQTEHRVVAVLTGARDGGGATVTDLARNLGLPVIPSERVKEAELADWIRKQRVDLLLNVHSLYIIHPDVLSAPRIGSFNLHPGPLPQYAGLNAPSWAIYFGETTHGVTVHWMVAEVDAGAIAYQSLFDITEEDTGLSVSVRCVREGLPLLVRLVEAASEGKGSVPVLEQDLTLRRYFGPEAPQDGKIQWSLPARRVVDFVRAADYSPLRSPWGHPIARLGELEIGIARATLTREPASEPPGTIGEAVDRAPAVATGDEWILVHRVQMGEKYVDPRQVLEPGQRLVDGA